MAMMNLVSFIHVREKYQLWTRLIQYNKGQNFKLLSPFYVLLPGHLWFLYSLFLTAKCSRHLTINVIKWTVHSWIFRHSLLATKLLAKIRESLNVDLTVKDLFIHASLSSLAKLIDFKQGTGEYSSGSAVTPLVGVDLRQEARKHDNIVLRYYRIIVISLWENSSNGKYLGSYLWSYSGPVALHYCNRVPISTL